MPDSIQNSKFKIQNSPDPVALALAEDIGSGDLTCAYFVDATRGGKARIFAKQSCVLAGTATAARAFALVDRSRRGNEAGTLSGVENESARLLPSAATVNVRIVREDGDALQPGDTALEISGPVRSILTGERTALNFIQRLSGVATLTRAFVDAVKPHRARILDTRKTTPGLRALEKAAVVAGGGTNHRIGLFDMVMVKDNHLAAGTTLATLQENLRRFRREHPGVRVELEADRLDQVRDFLTLDGVDVILLDNMTNAQLAEAVQLRGERPVKLEASGGVNLATVNSIAATGVDFISVGALTHSAPAVDFSLELIEA
jgi:nicotinate-nucleotide pyrophosphorylase (carboxylating)